MPTIQELFGMLPDKPSPEQMREIFDRYRSLMAAGDIEGICTLFSEDATWEEPIGTIVEIGRDAIRRRYEAALAGSGGTIAMVADGAVRVAGRRAVGASIASVKVNGAAMLIETANAITCNEEGKITEMKIYFGPSSIKPA
jgi:steroid delta-isomerase